MQQTVNAGPVQALFADANLRYITVGPHEILRQVYAAVRDHNWGTIPGQVDDLQIDNHADHFTITFKQTHRQNDVHFIWHGNITGRPDGTITFEFDGEALSTFRRNRIGFCVLHPMECAGVNCLVEHTDGSTTEGQFPALIAPHQPYVDIRAITHDVAPELQARVLMEGDTFEMEDQRNWTDASYKTYCTPLALPFPVTMNPGDKVRQKITISLQGDVTRQQQEPTGLTLTVGTETSPLPHLGLCANDDNLTHEQIHLLQLLKLSHLRVDVHLAESDWKAQLERRAAQAVQIAAPIELALFVSDSAETELKAIRPHLNQYDLARIMIFHKGKLSTREHWVQLGKTYLGDLNVPVGAGTDAFFTELNRERPPVETVDFVTYSLNPQVHAFDDASLVEALATQAVTVKTARSFSGDKPITISPVTLKMRWNPAATGPDPRIPVAEQIDPRQTSEFATGWTACSVKYLAEGRADSITYYQTTGKLGVVASSDEPAPEMADVPVGAYPLYRIFKQLSAFKGGEVIHSHSSDRLKVDGIIVRHNNNTCMILANFTDEVQQVQIVNVTVDNPTMNLKPKHTTIIVYTDESA